MNTVNLNKIELVKNTLKNKKAEFKVNPMDVNLAKIQMNLQKRCEREIVDYGTFGPVFEMFESKDPSRNISLIKVIYSNIDKNIHSLDIQITDRARINQYNYQIKSGTKQELLDIINNSKFFEICKNVVLCAEDIMKTLEK